MLRLIKTEMPNVLSLQNSQNTYALYILHAYVILNLDTIK